VALCFVLKYVPDKKSGALSDGVLVGSAEQRLDLGPLQR
jgi:hypothetical protein